MARVRWRETVPKVAMRAAPDGASLAEQDRRLAGPPAWPDSRQAEQDRPPGRTAGLATSFFVNPMDKAHVGR